MLDPLARGPAPPEKAAPVGLLPFFAAALGLVLMTFPIAGRTFGNMYKDFGSNVQLSLLTRLAVTWWFPSLLGSAVLACVAVGFKKPAQRRTYVVAAFLLGCAAIALCVLGVYLPIFNLAGNVRSG